MHFHNISHIYAKFNLWCEDRKTGGHLETLSDISISFFRNFRSEKLLVKIPAIRLLIDVGSKLPTHFMWRYLRILCGEKIPQKFEIYSALECVSVIMSILSEINLTYYFILYEEKWLFALLYLKFISLTLTLSDWDIFYASGVLCEDHLLIISHIII